jgi:protein-S-isoprenylcysteine O-methyltransferase Ste14
VEATEAIIFWGVLAGAAVSDGLLVFSIMRPDLRFWPLPPKPSWRYTVMRFAGPLTPLSLIGILALGALDWDSFAWTHWNRFVVGGLLFAAGGAFALWAAIGLGLSASQGHGGPLVARGAYRFSRNPQYVGTIAVLFGYALVCNSTLAVVGALVWISWYLLAPFAEESWLRERLGASFEAYAARVPRYLSLTAGWRD